MATPSASLDSSRESEPVMECRLVLTTLSGTVVEMTTSVAKHDRLEDLEDHVVDYLASVTDQMYAGLHTPHYANLPRRPNMGNLAK